MVVDGEGQVNQKKRPADYTAQETPQSKQSRTDTEKLSSEEDLLQELENVRSTPAYNSTLFPFMAIFSFSMDTQYMTSYLLQKLIESSLKRFNTIKKCKEMGEFIKNFVDGLLPMPVNMFTSSSDVSINFTIDDFSRMFEKECEKFSSFPDSKGYVEVERSLKIIDNMTSTIEDIQNKSLRKISELRRSKEEIPIRRIVTCMAIRDGKIAEAGTNRKISFFNLESILNYPDNQHYPLTILEEQEISNKSFISSFSWSPKNKNHLVSSDYAGKVNLWDIENGRIVQRWQEHSARIWNIDFNPLRGKVFASGSDDKTVKLYNTGCPESTATFEFGRNVCSVQFNPDDGNQLAIASSDKCAYIYDIRNYNEPLYTFKGHEMSVSHVRFISQKELVTASIDGSLRVWDITAQTCTRVLTGHRNEKNFIGLTNNGNHILCGSETNTVFGYHKDYLEPICSYNMRREEDGYVDHTLGFISTVYWENGYVLAANNHGKIHVLEIR